MSEQLLAIGRRQALFDRYPRSVLAKLSKRHARLFVEDAQLYLVDLGSLNGTLVNGVRLGAEPQALNSADLLSFGDLSFRVDIQEPPAERAVRPLRLVLKPDVPDSALESAVVSEFPFLVSKHSELFQQLVLDDPERLAFLSRKHAQIIRLGEQFYLEDLGSTNGTAINGQGIEEHVTRVNDGDRLSFGDVAISFRAFLVEVAGSADIAHPDEATELETVMMDGEPVSAEISAVLESGRTIMVDSATSFIDVYFNSASPKAAQDSDPPPAVTPPVGTVPRAVLEALVGDGQTARRWVQGGAAVVVLGLGVAGVSYWLGADARRLATLSEGDDPQATLALATRLLEERPDDEQLQRTARKALQQALLPDWYRGFEARDFEQAGAQLDKAQLAGAANPGDDELLELLSWATDVRAFLAAKDLSETVALDPFEEAQRVEQLLEFWTREPRQRTRVLRDLDDSDRALDGVADAVAADVRRLRALELDTEPLRTLAGRLAISLAGGDSRRVEALLEAVLDELRLPLAQRTLRADLESYRELEQTMQAERWLAARELVTGVLFQTRVFQDHAQRLLRDRLPDAAFVDAFAAAADAWQAGDADLSRSRLRRLQRTSWAAVAERRLAHQEELIAGAEALDRQMGQRGYPRALFDFYARLDAVQDQALVRQLQPAFKRYSTEALGEATASLETAERGWRRYNALGRIQTEHRLAAEVNQDFKVLAGLLKESLTAFERGVSIYRQLSREPSSSWNGLRDSLERELQVQRSALRNLQVLAPTVRERKLALLGAVSPGSGRG
ncbi:MAG: FHA domain-containing protein [Pseudomonadota bacterium]